MASVEFRERLNRPCEACRKRKDRCVREVGATICIKCKVNSRDCIILRTPRPAPVPFVAKQVDEALGSPGGPTQYPAPRLAPVSRAGSHRPDQENQMSVQDEQFRGLSERGEGLTLQVQERLSSLSLSLGKNSSSLGEGINSGPGFPDSVDFSRATRTFSLIARKNWNSSNPYAQISSTISKDNTEGECARQAKLLAYYGQKRKPCVSQYDFTTSQASDEATKAPASTLSNGAKPRLRSVPVKHVGGGILRCPECGHERDGGSECQVCGYLYDNSHKWGAMTDDDADLEDLDDFG